MFKRQPGFVMKMRAKPSGGPALLKLTSELFSRSSGIERRIVLAADDDLDTFWFFEIFDDEKALERHGQNHVVDAAQEKVRDLLAEPPLCIAVHPVAASWAPR